MSYIDDKCLHGSTDNLRGALMRQFRRTATVIFLQLLCPFFAVAAAPVISSLTPNTGAVGSAIVIAGSNFGTSAANAHVTFNGIQATISSFSSTSITAKVPTGATTGNAVVTVNSTASNGVLFTVTPPPSISSLTPATGAVGSSIVIAGSNFGPTQGKGKTTFNGTTATITSWSDTQIVAKVPGGATTGNVVVTAAGGVASSGVSFTVTPAPSIGSLVPNSGIVGASVTINGSNFGPTQGNGTVTFHGTTATINSWSATQITTTVPAGATTGNVIVTAAGGISSTGVAFTVIPPPSITSLTPTSGITGTSVSIAGSNFGATQGSSTVTFNGTAATVTSWSATKVVATVPTPATTGNIVVTVNTQASNGVKFTILPHITSDSPTTQPIGKTVTINGSGFGTSQGTSTVTFGGIAATASTWTTTQIVAAVPSGAPIGSDPIVVTVGGSASNSVAFTAVAALGVTASASPKPNANGWNNGNVTITYTCSGGVTPVKCPAAQTVSTEGANQIVSATATDANGNTASVSTTVSIDKTAPTITATATPAPNSKGVVTAPATINFTCVDSLSGVATCPSPIQVTTAGLNESFSGTATDKAGNTANATITVSVQTTPLAITATASPQPNAAGWNNTAVTISYTCSGGVAPLQCSASRTVSTEGANQVISAAVTDAAGQSANTSTSLNIDKTPPTISASVTPVPNAQGVVTAPATITFTCSDTVSGIANCPSPIQVTTLGLNESFNGTATDKAGNSANTAVTISIESSPLTITATTAPQANAAGWNNTAVTVSYMCSGGVAPLQCPASQMVSTQGINQINATVTDAAGETAAASVTVKIDTTPPTETPIITPAPNAAGWNNTAVTVSFTCSDSVSGIASCASPIQVSSEGAGQQVCGTVVDVAGNSASSCATVNIDVTPPVISASISPTPNANGIIFGPSATVTFTCSDALSGVATCPSPVTVTTQGQQTTSGTAFDIAGNSAAASIQFNLQNFPPLQVVASASPAPNAAGWNNTPVTVSFQCSGGAPPVSCPASQIVSVDGANQVITGTATDSVGSHVSASATVNLDQTPPTITATISPPPDLSGVNLNSATVSFSCVDSLSGIASCQAPITVTTPGTQTINGAATDNAGNNSTASVQVNVQTVPPLTMTATVLPPPNAVGWNNTPVTVTFQCSGGLPPVSCPAPQTVAADGANQVITATARDSQGTAVTASATVNLDQTPPSVSITSPADGTVFTSASVPVSGSVGDALSGIAAVSCNGTPAVVSLGTFNCTVQITQGSLGILVKATDAAGNSTTATTVSVSIVAPKLTITSPAAQDLFSNTSITVTGTIDDSQATVTVNGIQAANGQGTFTASGVILREGNNLVTATGTNAGGGAGTASVNVVLDTTPPTVRIDSPANNAILATPQIEVTGLVNDIVTGTVNAAQVGVVVNGVQASVANRSFMAEKVLLVPGQNVITATATDRAGNTSQSSVTVTLQEAGTQQQILVVSGNNQTGPVVTTLPQPLLVEVVNSVGQPLPNIPVTFAVIKSDGTVTAFPQQGRQVTVSTDANGQASVTFQVGSRVGPGNNQVAVTSPGFVGQVVFSASTTVGSPNQIHDVSGESQKGVIGQPIPEPLTVAVFDAGGNPVAQVPVTFAVQNGGGTLEGGSSVTKTTDADGRASAVLVLGPQEGPNANMVTASFAGLTNPPATFIAAGLTPSTPANTRVTGIVLDNANQPIPNATASIQGTNLSALTDAQGHFTILNAPVGSIVLYVDGSTSTRTESFPFLEFPMVTVAGQDNNLGRSIYLPPLDTDNSQIVGGDDDVTLTMKGVPGVLYTVFAHSATFPDGSKVGRLTLSQVHADKVPMIPPNGTAPRLVGTLQPSRVTFNPPIRVQFPNTDGLPPGTVTEIFSFHHDLEQFVSEGTARVSEDGSVIVSDPGFGLTVSGWHGGGGPPAPQGGAGGPPCPPPDTTGVTVKAQADGKDSKDAQFIDKPVQFTATVSGSCSSPQFNWDFGDGQNATSSDGSASHAYHDPNKYTANVTVQCSSTQCVSGTSAQGSTDVTAFKIKVKELTFHNNHDISKDTDGSTYTNPLWVTGSDDGSTAATQSPVSYTRNATMNLDVKLTTTPVLTDPVSITLEGDGPDGITFSKDDSISGADPVVSGIDADSELADKVQLYAPFQIQWKVTLQDSGSEQDINATKNAVYVTWADPLPNGGVSGAPSAPFLTTLHVGTTAGSGTSGSTDQTMVNAMWSKFTGLNVVKAGDLGADGAQMTYWKLAGSPGGEPGICQTLAGMIQTTDGTCVAWSDLWYNVLQTQGISGATVMQITSDQGVNPGANGFLIKKWAIGKHIQTGPSGIRKSDKAGDDEEVFPKNQGLPDSVCVAPNPSAPLGTGLVTTPKAGTDDHLGVPSGGGPTSILSGPNGICETTAKAADVQTTAVGTTTTAATTVCVTGGATGLHTMPAGDDVVAGNTITAGPNLKCETTAALGDIQALPVGNGAPNQPVIGPGANGVLDSTATPPDTVVDGLFAGHRYPYLNHDILSGAGPSFANLAHLAEAAPQARAPAQGNSDSPNFFHNHFVVQLGGKIYDPSYGTGPFDSQLAHENQAIDGITSCGADGSGGGGTCDNMTSPPVFVKKKNTAAQELKYTPMF